MDPEVFRSGTASARLHNASAAGRSQISQTVTLNQETPCPILVRAASRGANISDAPDRGTLNGFFALCRSGFDKREKGCYNEFITV